MGTVEQDALNVASGSRGEPCQTSPLDIRANLACDLVPLISCLGSCRFFFVSGTITYYPRGFLRPFIFISIIYFIFVLGHGGANHALEVRRVTPALDLYPRGIRILS